MDKERLLEAINAHDPDGHALDRVLKAAEATNAKAYTEEGMYKLSSKKCILARAWLGTVNQFGYWDASHKILQPHIYPDVVIWFDDGDRLAEITEMFKDEIQASHQVT